MENIQMMSDADLASVDGGTWKAWAIIGAAYIICPPLGLGMAVGYVINS